MDGTGVLQQLWDDHRVSAHLLRVMASLLSPTLHAQQQSLSVMIAIVAREREYGDLVHHAREELMFARMASRSDTGARAVQGLTHDHDELSRKGATLLESLQASADGKPEDTDLLRQRAQDYLDALGNHMRKEEQRVFPLAPQILTDEDWRLVDGAFAGRRDPLAPPVAPAYRALDAWLSSHGESVFDRRDAGTQE